MRFMIFGAVALSLVATAPTPADARIKSCGERYGICLQNHDKGFCDGELATCKVTCVFNGWASTGCKSTARRARQ